MPDIDLAGNDEFELDGDWELVSLDDGCWAEWEWPSDMGDKEQERLEEIWDENYFEGLEEEGWSQDDTEYYFQGPLKLVNLDTGEEFTGEEDEKEDKEAISENTEKVSVAWPFPITDKP
jgi:hypothetical protein